MKRFIVDWVGNYIFFVPIVLSLNSWNWSLYMVEIYLITSLIVSGIGGRAYTLFLKHFWYPLFGEKF